MQPTLTDVFQHLPDYWLVKDANLHYLHANNNFLQITRLGPESLTGACDFDMPWAQTHAHKYRQDDREVLSGKAKSNYIESQLRIRNKLQTVKVDKKPIVKDGQIVGILCHFIDIPDIKLSSRQTACLKLLVKGLSAKQIAVVQQLSVRTVEYYLAILKSRFNCRNKSELIIKAINLGI